MAKLYGTHRADTLNGTAGQDEIFGGNGNDTLFGNAGDDFLFGENGSDLLIGGEGNDAIDGGRGQDMVELAGNRADYRLTEGPNGTVIVRDLRAGGSDGVDTLTSVERVRFADGTFKTVDLISVNAAPVAADDAFTLAEDAGATDVTAFLLANDTDPDGEALAVSAVQAVSEKGATVTLNPDGTVSYDSGSIFASLEAGQTATDSFSYTVTDAAGLTSTATATVTITGVTHEPDAYFFVGEDETSEDLLALFNDWLNIQNTGVDDEGTLGSVAFDGETLTFTADDPYSDHLNHDQSHSTTFTVTGSNGEVKTILAVIGGLNDAIVAVDDAAAVGEGGTSENLWWTLTGNDQDVDNTPFLFEITAVDTAATQGTVLFDAYNRTLTYSAGTIELAPGETMTDSFTYTVTDGYGTYDTATVTVTVTGADDGSLTLSSSEGDDGALASAFLAEGETETMADAFGGLGQADMLVADVLTA